MSDAPASEDAPTDEVQPETDWKAEAEKLKVESRKWETRSKDNAKAAQRLAELEEGQKTELQRITDRAEAAEKRVQAFESAQQVTAWRAEVAEASGVPANLLRGSTREELAAHAEELKSFLPQNQRGPFVPAPGGIPDHPVTDDAAFARRLFTGQ